jgi:hypothetical protein
MYLCTSLSGKKKEKGFKVKKKLNLQPVRLIDKSWLKVLFINLL